MAGVRGELAGTQVGGAAAVRYRSGGGDPDRFRTHAGVHGDQVDPENVKRLDVFKIVIVREKAVEKEIIDLVVVSRLISTVREPVAQYGDIYLSSNRARRENLSHAIWHNCPLSCLGMQRCPVRLRRSVFRRFAFGDLGRLAARAAGASVARLDYAHYVVIFFSKQHFVNVTLFPS